MPVRQHTLAGIGSQVILQPDDLRTCGCDTYLRIQGIDAPGTQVEGIVCRDVIEILEIPGGTGSQIFMVARDWFGPGFMSSPRGIVTIDVLGIAAVCVSIIA